MYKASIIWLLLEFSDNTIVIVIIIYCNYYNHTKQ